MIDELELQEYSSTPAILADGQQVELPTFTCFLEWFESEYRTQIIANDGAHPLLGTMLLNGHDLSVSYKRKTVELSGRTVAFATPARLIDHQARHRRGLWWNALFCCDLLLKLESPAS